MNRNGGILKTTTLLFLRHGKTAYTGVLPDLTPEGIAQITESAEEIARIVNGRKSVQIITSPLPRARGSADIIAKRLGYSNVEAILSENAIRCMDFIDNEKANAVWNRFPSARHVDIAYPKDPCFESGECVEKRSAIQRRFLNYLAGIRESFYTGILPEVLIHTSHFEVLWSLAASWSDEEPLKHGEIFRIDMHTGCPVDENVNVTLSFRGRVIIQECPILFPDGLFSSEYTL